MSDTIELWELCKHGQIEAHDYDTRLGEVLLIRECPGGKKYVFDPANPPKAWTVWSEQGPLEWKFFVSALIEED